MKEDEKGGAVARTGNMRNAHKILLGKSEKKRSLERFRHRWEDNIIMDLKDIGWEDVDCFHLAQDRIQWQAHVNTVFHKRRRIP
jgi:K+-sensing histidine kinase KdpD